MTEWKIVAIDDDPSASSAPSGHRDAAVTVVGAILVAVGAYLPWLRANPTYESTGLDLVPSLMTPGIEMIHAALLFPAGVALAAVLARGPTRGWALASLVTGLWVVLFAVLVFGAQYTARGLRFIPEFGWLVTVCGGLLLAFVGGLALFEEEVPMSRRRL